MNAPTAPLLVDLAGLLRLIPASRATVGRWVEAGTFPAPIYVGRRRAWRVADIEGWVSAQSANRPPPAPGGAARRAAP